MPTAEIITIGTELLLGEIQDTNTRYLARNLRDCGVDLYRTMIVGDNLNRISLAIQEALLRSQIIITTGGLGPTVDDPTRQAIALAVGVELEFKPLLWQQILARFKRYGRDPGENNKRQAFIPQGASPVENPVGTAPAFIFERDGRSIISLPGVPREMEFLTQNAVLPYLREHFDLREVIKAHVLHTASIGESQVDELVGDLELLSNPTVGLLAHPGQVDIRVTAKANNDDEAEKMIAAVIKTIRQRLPDQIYGVDEDTIESVTLDDLKKLGWRLALIEAGLGGELIRGFTKGSTGSIAGEILSSPLEIDQFTARAKELLQQEKAEILLGASLTPMGERQDLALVILTPERDLTFNRSYGGPPQNARDWAVNLAIDQIRRFLRQDQISPS